MELYTCGNPDAPVVLIQPADGHDMAGMEKEVSLLTGLAGENFFLYAVKVGDWFRDLSPWKVPPVFGGQEFGDGARETLSEILELTGKPGKRYVIGGYSLAGLFALWAAYETGAFAGAAAA